MRIETFIIWKYLKMRKKRSLLLISSIAIGVALFLAFTSIIGGWSDVMLSKTVDLYVGDVTIFPHSNETFIDNYSNVINKIQCVKGIIASSPRLEISAVVLHEQKSMPVTIIGIYPEREVQVLKVGGYIKEGRFLKPKDQKCVVLGSKLASTLKTTVGSNLTIASVYAKMNVTVVGIINSGMYDIDQSLFYMPFSDVVYLNNNKNVATKIIIKTESHREAPVVAEKLQNMGLNAKSWETLAKPILEAVRIEGLYSLIGNTLILIIIGFGILTVSYMWVSEKTRDIGILKALGLSNKQILIIYLLNNLILAIVGSIIGCLFGTLFVMYFSNLQVPSEFYGISRFPVHLRPETYILITLFAIGITLLFSVLPARRASRLNPVEALRYVL